MKICSKCVIEKPITEFYVRKNRASGYCSECKDCTILTSKTWSISNRERKTKVSKTWKINNLEKIKKSALKYRTKNHEKCLEAQRRAYRNNKKAWIIRDANRRALKLKATPKWSNLKKIKEIYMNCPKGYHVDHIIPLKGVNVCGLHVEHNLQYLPAIENIRKGNRLEKVG